MTTLKPKNVETKIDEQIDATRNVDAETAKPRLPPARPSPEPSTSKEEQKPHKSKNKAVKPTAPTSELHPILLPFMRYPLQGKTRPEVSTFIPSPYMMYYIVHLMDDVIRKNTYFRRQQDAWHPFVSRLYFGIIFMIQTLRAQVKSSKAPPAHVRFLKKFLLDYPPEQLAVPGPLVTLFESLAAAKPTSSLEGFVTPVLPSVFGPIHARTLIDYNQDNIQQLLLPNIPVLLGFLGTITSAQANAVPDYSQVATFNDTAARTLNGHVFNANNWTPAERAALHTPGLLHLVETDANANINFNLYGRRLSLPIPQQDDNLSSLGKFTYLGTDNTWFGKISPIMSTYCTYFKDSTTLAACSPTNTISPLITAVYATTPPPPRENSLATLNHAFPEYAPFTLTAAHTSTEPNLAPASSMLAQAAQLNVQITATNADLWHNVSLIGTTRTGSYWIRSPPLLSSKKESNYKGLEVIINKTFALTRSQNK